MKIVCISDTHSLHKKIKIPEGDLLIVAGDITNKGNLTDLSMFNQWLGKLKFKEKVCIAGNHDFCFERDLSLAKSVLSNATYLHDSEVIIDGLKIYGSPWTPKFFNWAFNVDRGPDIWKYWENIPLDTDILVTHGPPYGILDKNLAGTFTGCESLFRRVSELSLKLHVFGHIHESYGQVKIGETLFVNASICDVNYAPVNAPIVIEI